MASYIKKIEKPFILWPDIKSSTHINQSESKQKNSKQYLIIIVHVLGLETFSLSI